MSRLRVQEALAERLEEVRERLLAAYDHFRESRLCVQAICTAILVGTAWLVHLAPYGPLADVDAAMVRAIREDYDFAGKARQASDWATARGGWGPAVAGLWQQGLGQVRDWVGPVGPFAPRPATTSGAEATLPSVPPTPLQPVEGSVLAEYGWPPKSVSEEFHEGIDFYTTAGAPVVAILDGTVQEIRLDQRLGTVVEVRHGKIVAVYGQVEAVTVRAGDAVSRGQQMATVAHSRGVEQAMPPHLHFEIRPVSTGLPVDPASYLGLGGKKL